MTNRVWVLGDAVVDLVPDEAGRLLKCPGGAPANVAVGVARLSGDSAFIGHVGQDPLGRFMQHTLQQEQVDTRFMSLDPEHATSTVLVDLDENGERSFTFLVKPSADLFLRSEELPTFQAGEWLHACSIALSRDPSRHATYTAMQAIRAAGGFVSFDPNIREEVWSDPTELKPCIEQALALADVVKLSDEELAFLCPDQPTDAALAELMRRFPIRLLLLTQGSQGVLAHDRQCIRRLPARRVEPLDTTGAGDAFVAGLLAGLSRMNTWPDWSALDIVLTQAQGCGALATTARGAMTALPNHQQLQAFLS